MSRAHTPAILVCAAFVAQASSTPTWRVTAGMTAEEVRDLLGEPESIVHVDDGEEWLYDSDARLVGIDEYYDPRANFPGPHEWSFGMEEACRGLTFSSTGRVLGHWSRYSNLHGFGKGPAKVVR